MKRKLLVKGCFFVLSGNVLKIIAAVSMLIDHIGVILFPGVRIFRIIGRIAFPIFAYMIAEGCRYTKNKYRYFGNVIILAVVLQLVYFIAYRSTFLNILYTFALSMIGVFALQNLKKKNTLCSVVIFGGCIVCIYYVCQIFDVDYGFWGCMLPVFASIMHNTGKYDRKEIHVLIMGICLLQLSLTSGGVQPYSLLSLPLLLMYSGNRGRLNMKYFFYIFYPAHLVVLECIAWLIN